MPGGVNGAKGAKKAAEYIKNKQIETKPAQPQKDSNKLADALSNQNSTNNNGNVVGNGGDVIDSGNNNGNIGSGNVTNSGNTTIINNPPQPEPNPPSPPKKTKKQIPPGDIESGKSLAKQMHEQTNSRIARNAVVNDAFSKVDADNAYSFFKEYKGLAGADRNPSTTGAMHDAHSLSEIFTDVENKNTFPAVRALVEQARAAGVPDAQLTPLESLMQNYAFERGGDITADTGAKFDRAITNLLSVMSNYVTE